MAQNMVYLGECSLQAWEKHCIRLLLDGVVSANEIKLIDSAV